MHILSNSYSITKCILKVLPKRGRIHNRIDRHDTEAHGVDITTRAGRLATKNFSRLTVGFLCLYNVVIISNHCFILMCFFH